MERWRLAAGWGDCGPVDSGRTGENQGLEGGGSIQRQYGGITRLFVRVKFIFLRRIGFIHQVPSVDSTKTPVSALASLGYSTATHSFQLVLNTFLRNDQRAKTPLQTSCSRPVSDHVSSLLRPFHWLPIQARIEQRLSPLCQSFFSDIAPVYLTGLLRVYSPSRQLRSSSDSRILCI